MQNDTYLYFLKQGIEAEKARTFVFLIYTPLLLLLSWTLTILVDAPAKELSIEFDRIIRGKVDKHESKCSRIWPIFAFIAWLLFVAITIEIYDYKKARVAIL